LTWSAIWWVLDREDGLAVVSSLLRHVVAIGFFYALLLNGGTWVPAVIQSFSQAGATAAGLTDLSPTGVFDQGLALANKILNATSDLGLLDGFFASLIAGITAIVVVIAFAVIAAQLLVALVESFIVIGAGVLFLGFAGSRWTKFFTERYLSYIATIGVKLFVQCLNHGRRHGHRRTLDARTRARWIQPDPVLLCRGWVAGVRVSHLAHPVGSRFDDGRRGQPVPRRRSGEAGRLALVSLPQVRWEAQQWPQGDGALVACEFTRGSIGRAVGYRQPGSRVRPQLHRHVGRRAGSGPGKA
jgi:hypothetical protein